MGGGFRGGGGFSQSISKFGNHFASILKLGDHFVAISKPKGKKKHKKDRIPFLKLGDRFHSEEEDFVEEGDFRSPFRSQWEKKNIFVAHFEVWKSFRSHFEAWRSFCSKKGDFAAK